MAKKSDTASWALASEKELLSRKVSTSVLLSILDDLLYSAMEPLYKKTTLFRRVLMQVILFITEDNRRRVSQVERNALNAWLLKAVYDTRMDFFAKSKLDRGMCVEIIMLCVQHLEPIEQIEYSLLNKKTRIGALEQRRKLGLLFGADEDQLFSLYRWCKSYISLYQKFKERVFSRYYRLAYHETNRMYHAQSNRIDTPDLFKNLLISTWRTIDKCDASKGHITSLVQRSFVNARMHSEFTHEKSLAYDVPFAARHALGKQNITINNQSTSLSDDDSILETLVDAPTQEDLFAGAADSRLLLFLRSIPGCEMGLLMLGIQFQLTEVERKRLEGIKA